jgi:hypothetical protein
VKPFNLPFHALIESAVEEGVGDLLDAPYEELPLGATFTREGITVLTKSFKRLRVGTLRGLLSDPRLWTSLAADVGEHDISTLVEALRGWFEDVADRRVMDGGLLAPGGPREAHAPPPAAAAMPDSPVPLESWAQEQGVEPLLKLKLSSFLDQIGLPYYTGWARGLKNPTVREFLIDHAPSARGKGGRSDHLSGEVSRRILDALREAASLVQAQRAWRDGLEGRSVEPEEPELAALLGWLRAGRASLGPALAAGDERAHALGRISFHLSPPRLDYEEHSLLGRRSRLFSVSLGDWVLAPFEPPAATKIPPALATAALDVAIEVVRDPTHPARAALLAWLRAPIWTDVLRSLDARLAPPPAATATRLVFRVSLARHSLEVKPVVQKLLAKGGYSAGSVVQPEKLLGRGGVELDELEELILSRVSELRARGSYGSDGTARAIAMLDLLGRHPRVFLESQPDVPLRVVRPRLRLELVPAGNGLAPVLAIGPRRLSPSQLMDAIDPRGRALLLDEKAATISIVRVDELARPLLAAMAEQTLVFPPEAQAPLVERAARLSASFDVVVPEALSGRAIEPDERMVLRLEPLPAGLTVAMVVRPVQGGAAYPPGEGPSTVLGSDGSERVHADRRLGAERERALSLVATLGLGTQRNARPGERDEGGAPFSWQIDDDQAAVGLLEALEPLSQAGEVSLEWPKSGERPRLLGAASPAELRVKISRQRDWFGVEGGVEIDGVNVALASLLEAARLGQRYVSLGHRRYVALTSELRQRLLVADGVVFAGKQGLEASALAAPALSSLVESDEQLDADRAFLELRARISAGKGVVTRVPAGLKAELRPYQVEGFQWLMRLAAWGAGACLADEMGLGKTLQTLGVLVARAKEGPQLVVAPTSVGPGWVAEATRFAPALTPLLYRGAARAEVLAAAGKGDVLITSYDILARDAAELAAIDFATLVLDEAQSIKNAATRRAKAAATLSARFRVALTGTPVENHLGELWSIYRVTAPGLLGSWEHFQARFAAPIERSGDATRRAALGRLLRPFLLRRTKVQVAPDLPERIELVKLIELSPGERALYEAARQQAVAAIASLDSERDGRFAVLAELTRLRRLACHPRLLDPTSIIPSSKLAAFLDLLAELREEGHRALVFSQFTSHLALVRQPLDAAKIPYLYLDGSTPSAERARLVEAFQKGSAPLFLISLKAGGTGLNLTAADTVVHLDPWWNPAVEDQASDRAHRIGQTRTVTIIRLIARGTIEEAVVSLHSEKRALAESLLEGAEVAGRMTTRELSALVLADAEGDPEDPELAQLPAPSSSPPLPAPPRALLGAAPGTPAPPRALPGAAPGTPAPPSDAPVLHPYPSGNDSSGKQGAPSSGAGGAAGPEAAVDPGAKAASNPAASRAQGRRPTPRPPANRARSTPPPAPQPPATPERAPRPPATPGRAARLPATPASPESRRALELLVDGCLTNFARGRSPDDGVVRQYHRSLMRFIEHASPRIEPGPISVERLQAAIDGYLADLVSGQVSAPASEPGVARTALRHLLRHLGHQSAPPT